MKHGLIGCSNIVKAVVLQGMLAEAGVYGRIERGHTGYAVRVTHEAPLDTVTMGLSVEHAAPRLVWSNPRA